MIKDKFLMMNYKFLILTTVTTLLAGLASSQTTPAGQSQPTDSSYANSYYEMRMAYFRKLAPQQNAIVFLGNSITEQGEWQELLDRKNVLNRGISGDVSFGILARLEELLRSKPGKIFLMMGINDMKRGTGAAVILKNYVRLIHQVKKQSPHTRLYIQSILPVYPAMLPKSYEKLNNDDIKAMNMQLTALCREYGLTYINLWEVMGDENQQLKKSYTIDGLHLKAATYILWADYLKKIKAL